MSQMRPLPQRPGQGLPDEDRGFIYPPYPRSQPPFERHHSYPIPPHTPGMYDARGQINHRPSINERQYYQMSNDHGHSHLQPPASAPPTHHRYQEYHQEHSGMNGNSNGNGSGNGTINGDGGSAKKKRPRELSLSDQDQRPVARRQSTSKTSRRESNAAETKANAPPVLIREKKQKACSNCRRAKLKCIVNDGESECVRCKSRTERCVFFPRSHDEDWQQTITQDVYAGMSHLSAMSAALNHMVTHLVNNNIIPPLPSQDFPQGLAVYEMPDRDMTVLQGWTAEKNREGSARKGKRKGRGTDDDEDEDEPRQDMDPRSAHIAMVALPMQPISADRLPPDGWGQISPDHGQAINHLPPYRAPLNPGQVQLTPTSELDLPPRQQPYPFQPLAPSPSANMSSSMLPVQLPQMPGQIVTGPSPHSIHNATPTSLISHISPAIVTNLLPQLDPIGPDLPEPDLDVVGMDDQKAPLPPPVPMYDEDGTPIIGSADGRNNVVKKGLINHRDATMLVEHFHANMAQYLYGYRLELGQFPYLREGPATITPFILGVECMLTASRIPQFRDSFEPLREYVISLLRHSPAESWQNLETSEAEHNTDGSRDVLDPELGIGPEEIVGACVLASYIGSERRAEGATIAELAFIWARGWIKLLKGKPRWTFAENLGIVPQERQADWLQMCRIWLLCYVVEGAQQLGTSATVPLDSYSPATYCEDILTSEDPENISPYDVILTHRALLVEHLRNWYHRSTNLYTNGPDASSEIKRLGRMTNRKLDDWESHYSKYDCVPPQQSRQLRMYYDFARVLVHTFTVSRLAGLGSGGGAMEGDEGVRLQALLKASEAGMDFLQLCIEWSPHELANLPTNDLHLITNVTGLLVDAVTPGKGYDVETPDGRRVLTPGRVDPLLRILADKFHGRHDEMAGPPYVRTADVVVKYAATVEALCREGRSG